MLVPIFPFVTFAITNINKANTCTITLTKNQYTVNVSSNNTTYGTVSPASRTVEHGGYSLLVLLYLCLGYIHLLDL